MHSIAWWPTLTVLAIATFTDVRSRRIPNWLVLPFLVNGVVVFGWMGGMGMGDMKLCAAVGAWIGPAQLMVALVVMAMAGGIMALGWALGGGFIGELFDGAGDLVFGFKKRGLRPHPELVLSNPLTRKMPYAPAIAVGTLISFFSR